VIEQVHTNRTVTIFRDIEAFETINARRIKLHVKEQAEGEN